MSLPSKVERIKWELGLDPGMPLSLAVTTANDVMRVEPSGPLPEQVDRLLVVMGIALRSDNINLPTSASAAGRPQPRRSSEESLRQQRPPPPNDGRQPMPRVGQQQRPPPPPPASYQQQYQRPPPPGQQPMPMPGQRPPPPGQQAPPPRPSAAAIPRPAPQAARLWSPEVPSPLRESIRQQGASAVPSAHLQPPPPQQQVPQQLRQAPVQSLSEARGPPSPRSPPHALSASVHASAPHTTAQSTTPPRMAPLAPSSGRTVCTPSGRTVFTPAQPTLGPLPPPAAPTDHTAQAAVAAGGAAVAAGGAAVALEGEALAAAVAAAKARAKAKAEAARAAAAAAQAEAEAAEAAAKVLEQEHMAAIAHARALGSPSPSRTMSTHAAGTDSTSSTTSNSTFTASAPPASVAPTSPTPVPTPVPTPGPTPAPTPAAPVPAPAAPVPTEASHASTAPRRYLRPSILNALAGIDDGDASAASAAAASSDPASFGSFGASFDLLSALKDLRAQGLLESCLKAFAPPRPGPHAPLDVPSFRRRSLDAAIKHLNAAAKLHTGSPKEGSAPEGGVGAVVGAPEGGAASKAATSDVPPTTAPTLPELALYGDGLVERLTGADLAEHAASLGVPHRTLILACTGDGIEHLLLRMHLYLSHAPTGQPLLRAQSHCLLIGANNLLADLGQAEQVERAAARAPGRAGAALAASAALEAALEAAASPALVVQGIQEIVDLLRASQLAETRAHDSAHDSAHGGDGGTGDSEGKRARGHGNGGNSSTGAHDVVDGDARKGAGGEGGNLAEGPAGAHDSGSSDDHGVFVCKLLHVVGTQPWVAQANERIDAVNALLQAHLRGATLLRPSIPAERKYYDASGIHLSLIGYKRLVAQLTSLVPTLNASAKAEARKAQQVADEEAAAAMAAAQAALEAAETARKVVLQSKLHFSRAKAETAQAIRADADIATEAARIAAIEYKYWSEGVASARTRAAAEVLQASMRARRARLAGEIAPTVGAAILTASAREHATTSGDERSQHERFGLWTRKRSWAATVLQTFVRSRMLDKGVGCEPCDDDDEFADEGGEGEGADGACFRCGQLGHRAKRCRMRMPIDPSVPCKAKLRLRPYYDQRVDEETGELVTRIRVGCRLYVGPISQKGPTKLRLRVEPETGHVIAEIQLWYRERNEEELDRSGTKRALCRFFERFGNCSRGGSCPYAHGWVELTDEAKLELAAEREKQSVIPVGRMPMRRDDLYGHYKTRLCETWTATGQCALGSTCSFAHGDEELQRQKRGLSEREIFKIEQANRSKICRSWQMTGECPNGTACLFRHTGDCL